MNQGTSVHSLLKTIGANKSKMSVTPYDTSWLARLAELGEPLGERALDWLRASQLPDGSWGAQVPLYYHDRLVCTLAAMTVLARQGTRSDHLRCLRAQPFLERAVAGLGSDATGETIGFEMIVPALLGEAENVGFIGQRAKAGLEHLVQYRAAKLAALPDGLINRHVTVAFSAEMVGSDGLNLLDVDNLQEANHSVGHSPSATAHFVRYVRPLDPAALQYLYDISVEGAVPTVAPSDVFELSWVMWNLLLADLLDDEARARCHEYLDFLQGFWKPGEGIPQASGYTPRDSDDTSLVFELFARFGRPLDLDAILCYEVEEYFRCFLLEANPSLSANVHVLGALRQAGLTVDHPSVEKVRRFLRRTQTVRMFWLDKWHASPYYPTAHAIVAAAGYDDDLIEDAIFWILTTQGQAGGWGYYAPTAEETAYCLQALVLARRHGHDIPRHAIRRGADWLAEHGEPPYMPIWIGKCLYCPELVVRSAVLSALTLAAQE